MSMSYCRRHGSLHDTDHHPRCPICEEEPVKWIVGLNMPGYMPVSDPSEVETYEDALKCLLGELERSLDDLLDDLPPDDELSDEERSELIELADAIALVKKVDPKKEQEIGITCGRYHYWVAPSLE